MTRTYYQDFVKDDGRPVTVEYSYRGGSETTYSPHSGAVGGDGCEVEIVDVMPATPEFDELSRRWLDLTCHPTFGTPISPILLSMRADEDRELLQEIKDDMAAARKAIALTEAEEERITQWLIENHKDDDYGHDEPF